MPDYNSSLRTLTSNRDKNMRYYEFRLVEGYPQAQAAFAQVADAASVQKTIADFKQLVSRNQIKDANQKNIDYWIKQGWENFNQFVNQAAAVPSKTQITRKKAVGQSINLVDNNEWLIVIPIDKEASCFHGKNSDWCTTKIHQGHFESYFYKSEITLIYCIKKATGGMWAIAAHKKTDTIELFDQNDMGMEADEFTEETGLNPMELRNMALGDAHQPKIQANRDKWKASVELTEQLLKQLPKQTRSPEIEKQLTYNKEGNLCVKYIYKMGMRGEVKANELPLAIQVAAAGNDGHILSYIENPVEAVQIAAVISQSNDRDAYEVEEEGYQSSISMLIEEGITPSERVQLTSVDHYAYTLEDIIEGGITPSEAVQLLAVRRRPDNLIPLLTKKINPSEEVIETAVARAPSLIRYVVAWKFKLTEKMQIEAAKTDPPNAIQNIIDAGIIPSEAVQLTAVDQEYKSFKTFEIIMGAVINGKRITPSEAVQAAAVKQDSRSLELLKKEGVKLSPAVKQAAGVQ